MARGSIVKRGRSYSIVYYVDGRQRWKSLGPVTRKEAERHLREILNEIQDGTFRDLKPISFREYAKKWLEFHRANVKPSSYDSYRSVVNGHLVTAFGDHALSAIARPSLRQFTADLLETGRSPKTAPERAHDPAQDPRGRARGRLPAEQPRPQVPEAEGEHRAGGLPHAGGGPPVPEPRVAGDVPLVPHGRS